MPTPTPRPPQPAPLPPGGPRHARTAAEPTATAPDGSAQSVLQQRLRGAFLTIIGIAGLIGGVLFSIEAPRFTPVPVVFLTFWLVMVIVGKILFAGLGKLRDTGVGAPAPSQVRAAAAVAGIVVTVGMMGFAATGTGAGVAAAAPCPGGGPATCGPTGPDLTFAPPTGQATAPGGQQGQQGGQDQQGIAPGGQQGQQGGQDQQGIATSPTQGGDNGPGIQAQTPQFGTPGQQAPNIPGNEQPGGQGGGQQQGQQPQGNGQGQQNQNPTVQTTAPGGPQQPGQQQPGQTQSGQPSSPTVTVTKTESQCALPGAGNGAGTPGSPGSGDSSNNNGGTDPDNGRDGENKDGAPSWAYLVGEVTALMTGRRGRKAGPLNKDGSTPTNKMIPGDQIDGDNYKQWTTPDGDRTYILSENEDAPSQYRFALNQPPGGSSKVNDDGSVSVFDRDGNQVNRFDTPWAYDSVTGEKIPTRYTLDGDDLVQTIDRPEGNNNPILADPNPDGTSTPEEAAAADKIRELAAQGNPMAQQMAQSLPSSQPPTPPLPTAQELGVDPSIMPAVFNSDGSVIGSTPPPKPAPTEADSSAPVPSAQDLGIDPSMMPAVFNSDGTPITSGPVSPDPAALIDYVVHAPVQSVGPNGSVIETSYDGDEGALVTTTYPSAADRATGAPVSTQKTHDGKTITYLTFPSSNSTTAMQASDDDGNLYTVFRDGSAKLIVGPKGLDQGDFVFLPGDMVDIAPDGTQTPTLIETGPTGQRSRLEGLEKAAEGVQKIFGVVPYRPAKYAGKTAGVVSDLAGLAKPDPSNVTVPGQPSIGESPVNPLEQDPSKGAPGSANGYPTPRSLSGKPNVSQDQFIDRFGGRITEWNDGGWVRYGPLDGRASTGMVARITPNMLGEGTDPNPKILPPGWDPKLAWDDGPLQRGHGLANRLGGTGKDARNLFTITNDANEAMRVLEDQVASAVARTGQAVDYTVIPVYGNGATQAPTEVIVRAVGAGLNIYEPITNIPVPLS